ncbi:MAG: DNA replication protein DnaC [Clostridia bacterium]|nr:DNA replication protein DnaC [Clostridia bacterium]
MTYDGKLLARARALIEHKRQENESEHARRQAETYSRIPELSDIDVRTAGLMAGIATRALDGGSMAEEFAKNRFQVQALSERRKALLLENGFAEDYTDEINTCPVCRDTGYVEGRMCECLLAAYRAETVKELSSVLDLCGQSFDSFDLGYYDDVHGQNGDSPRSIMTATYEFCKKYANEFRDTSPNLLFRGGTGLGKTFLSACIAKVVSGKGYSVVYDTCVSVMDAFEAQKFGRGDADEADAKVRRYLGCDLLILDDLGTEMSTSFVQSALYTLINTRLTNGKKTVISTNLTPEEMRSRYSAATVSRLEGEYIVLQFAGQDIRRLKRS